MNNVTFEQIKDTLVLILTIVAFYTAVMTAVKTHREEKHRKDAPIEEIKTMLANDKARLDNHDKILSQMKSDMDDTKEGLNCVAQGVTALLEHELHNGNSEQMEKASEGISQWVWKGRA